MFKKLMEDFPSDAEPVAMYSIKAVSLARGGEGSVQGSRKPGAVVAASRLRHEGSYMHTPVLDPATCVCSGPHGCYSVLFSDISGKMQQLPVNIAFVYHFVEMFERNRGRCAHQHKRCEHLDDSFAWVTDVLRDTTWPEEWSDVVRSMGPRKKETPEPAGIRT